jgi:hypothetical protein
MKTTAFYVLTPIVLEEVINVSEEHPTSIFRVDLRNVRANLKDYTMAQSRGLLP